jgi:hypothetical protein
MDRAIGLYVGPSRIRGGGAQEGNLRAEDCGFQGGAELIGDQRLDDKGLSAPLQLLRPAITRLADDRTDKVQLGRAELGRIEGS